MGVQQGKTMTGLGSNIKVISWHEIFGKNQTSGCFQAGHPLIKFGTKSDHPLWSYGSDILFCFWVWLAFVCLLPNFREKFQSFSFYIWPFGSLKTPWANQMLYESTSNSEYSFLALYSLLWISCIGWNMQLIKWQNPIIPNTENHYFAIVTNWSVFQPSIFVFISQFHKEWY